MVFSVEKARYQDLCSLQIIGYHLEVQ